MPGEGARLDGVVQGQVLPSAAVLILDDQAVLLHPGSGGGLQGEDDGTGGTGVGDGLGEADRLPGEAHRGRSLGDDGDAGSARGGGRERGRGEQDTGGEDRAQQGGGAANGKRHAGAVDRAGHGDSPW